MQAIFYKLHISKKLASLYDATSFRAKHKFIASWVGVYKGRKVVVLSRE